MIAVVDAGLLSFAGASAALAIRKLTRRFHKSPYVGGLLKCAFCLGFWTSLCALLAGEGFLGITATILVAFAIYGGSIVVMGVVQKLWLWDADEIEYLQDALSEARRTIEEMVDEHTKRSESSN